ncbi:hypothetical protein, partial [Escherichia coli]|uniref:hypothetical protein n=1 Tax=Escherichia coli TaxID=562 RepID=UPI0013D853DE
MAAVAASQEPSFEALLAGDLDTDQLHTLADHLAARHAVLPKGDGGAFHKALALAATSDVQRAELA